jgi:hypothetical protein
MCFRFLQVAAHFSKTWDLPHHDPSSEVMTDEVRS